MRKYKSNFRNKVIEDAKIMGLVKAANYNKISPQSIVSWCKQQNISFKRKAAIKKCVVCGKEFKYNKSTNRLCCSQKCRKAYDVDIRTCLYCGIKYKTIKSTTRKYCSHSCYAKSNQIKNHAKKRRGSNWNTIRRQFKKDPCLCKMCNEKAAIDLHHIIPYKYFKGNWESANNEFNLIALCKDCHYKAEKHVRFIFKVIDMIENKEAERL